jgi:hypothetical protein
MMSNASLAGKVAVVVGGACLVSFVAALCKAQVSGPAGAVIPAQTAVISTQAPDHASAPNSTVAKATGATDSVASAGAPSDLVQKAVVEIKATAEDLKRLTAAERRKWNSAIASFPGFCQDWNRMLHDRELNNLSNLQWQEKSGYETASYTGYGKVEGCQAKESTEGIPIGKVTYEEIKYYLTGKSIDEAMSHPQLLGKTNTLEIFSFEKDRWFY